MAIAEKQITEVMEAIVGYLTYDETLHFAFGHYAEIANKLTKENRNNQKYPLFALILDVTERESEEHDVYKSLDFNMIIAYKSKDNYSSEQRRDLIFKPILQPLYRKLIDEMILNRDFNFKISSNFIDHTKYDRYFLGSQSSNQNRLNDYVDAIEIEFRNIKLKKQINC